MRRAISATVLVVGAAATVAMSPAAFADHPRYRLVDLGGLTNGGRDASNAYAVNELGQVVGWATLPDPLNPSNDIGRAFLWTPNGPDLTGGTMQDLGILPGAPGHSAALGINDAGQVVGYSGTGERSRAFLWQPATPGATAGVMRDLGELPGGSDNSRAWGINRGGQITGYADTTAGRRPFLWNPAAPNSPAGSMTDLGLPFAGIQHASASAINDCGQILGTALGADKGFLWTPDIPGGTSGSFRGFGPPPEPFDGRLETGLNNLGQVAGAVFATAQNQRASVWTPDDEGAGTTALIGDPLNGYLFNWAKAINDGGTVVGTMTGTTGGGPPPPGSTGLFIWSADDGMADLVSRVDRLPPNWTLVDAVDISNAGMIVGTGLYELEGGRPGPPRGYLLVPVPEPGAGALMLGSGGCALLTRRRRD